MAISESTTLGDEAAENSPDMDDLTPDKRRAVRARTESMVVIPETDDDGVCTGIYEVRTESGSTYTVVIDQPRCCNCPDTEYRNVSKCKHRRRTALEITENGCPAPGEAMGDYADRLDEVRTALESEREAMRDDLETIESMMGSFEA